MEYELPKKVEISSTKTGLNKAVKKMAHTKEGNAKFIVKIQAF